MPCQLIRFHGFRFASIYDHEFFVASAVPLSKAACRSPGFDESRAKSSESIAFRRVTVLFTSATIRLNRRELDAFPRSAPLVCFMTSLVLVYARSKVFLIRATAESRLSALILDCAPTFSSPSCQKPLSSR